jgi:hypothetical protein
VLYLDNYWSVSFSPKCDPLVFGVFHFHKYFGNLPNFISHAIPNFQKHRSLTVATLLAATPRSACIGYHHPDSEGVDQLQVRLASSPERCLYLNAPGSSLLVDCLFVSHSTSTMQCPCWNDQQIMPGRTSLFSCR